MIILVSSVTSVGNFGNSVVRLEIWLHFFLENRTNRLPKLAELDRKKVWFGIRVVRFLIFLPKLTKVSGFDYISVKI